MKGFDFYQIHSYKIYFNCVWTFVQMENKSFWLEIN